MAIISALQHGNIDRITKTKEKALLKIGKLKKTNKLTYDFDDLLAMVDSSSGYRNLREVSKQDSVTIPFMGTFFFSWPSCFNFSLLIFRNMFLRLDVYQRS